MRERLDVLAVIRAPLEQYPPSVNQLSILADAGLRVAVVDTCHDQFPKSGICSENPVKRLGVAGHTLFYREAKPPAAIKLKRFIQFRYQVSTAIRRYHPRVLILYDAAAFFMASAFLGNERRVIVHLHDLPGYHRGAGWGTKLSTDYTHNRLPLADLVIHPDRYRANAFAERIHHREHPAVVMNCPRRLDKLPPGLNHESIGTIARPNSRIVHFHGWIGPSRGIEVVLQSVKDWPEDANLVLAGPVSPDYQKTLLATAAANGVLERVHLTGLLDRDTLMRMAVTAEIAYSVISDHDNLNWRYSAGAINKRFEYMSLGKSQVTNDGLGVDEIIGKSACGLLVDSSRPMEIGRAIQRLLTDYALRRSMEQNARRAHLQMYNYEYQFAPVKETILGWLNENTASEHAK